MTENTNRSVPSQVILGVAVIALGVLFLLDNLDLISFHHALHFWPMAFILFGALKMYDSRTPSGLTVGGALVLVGVVMTMSRLGYVYFSWHALWPLLLIVVGASVLMRANESRRALGGADSVNLRKDEDPNVVDMTAILGGFDRRLKAPSFRGGEATAILGGCALDLRESNLEGEAVLNVFAFMGGVELKVPSDWTVVMNGTAFMGGFNNKRAAEGVPGKRLLVRGYAIMGGVEVRN
jgi:predicted membrane protein